MRRAWRAGQITYLARAHVRVGWRGLLAVALLAGVASAATMTLLGGARRTSSALERSVSSFEVADVSLDVTSDRLEEVRDLPGVTEATTYTFVAVRPAGTELVGG